MVKNNHPCCFKVTRFHFNPLPREEGDAEYEAMNNSTDSISIHSLVKRETYNHNVTELFTPISIHSLVKRETNLHEFTTIKFVISIHSLVKRET